MWSGRGDVDGINAVALGGQQFAPVGVGARIGHATGGAGEAVGIHVAQRDHYDAGVVQEVAAGRPRPCPPRRCRHDGVWSGAAWASVLNNKGVAIAAVVAWSKNSCGIQGWFFFSFTSRGLEGF